MRRGINIRKKKKIILKQINNKSLKLLTLATIILIICATIYIFFIQDVFIKINLEQDSTNFSMLNENIPFSIQKIILFSSATAEADSVNQLLSLDISNYCDIGIYLNKIEDENTLISSLYIDNISISNQELGSPYIYKKVLTDLGKSTFDKNNIIDEEFNFNIINTEDTINYNNYELYCDGSTPITLGFYNQNIKTNYIPNDSEILYNGTLLKDATIPLTSLKCNISFRINIISSTNEHYICNVNFDIPYESDNGTLYNNPYITKEFSSNETNKFIRIK